MSLLQRQRHSSLPSYLPTYQRTGSAAAMVLPTASTPGAPILEHGSWSIRAEAWTGLLNKA